MKHLLPNWLYFKLYKHNRNRWDKNKHTRLYRQISIIGIFVYFIGVSFMMSVNFNIAVGMVIFASLFLLIKEVQ